MIRPGMLRILLGKEFLRLRKNPGAVMLLGLLTVIALLVSLSWTDPAADQGGQTCWIVYSKEWTESPWIEYLSNNEPSNPSIQVVAKEDLLGDDGELAIAGNECAIELPPYNALSQGRFKAPVIYHFPIGEYESITPSAAWFWATWKQFSSQSVRYEVYFAPHANTQQSNMASMIRTTAADQLNIELIATMLLLAVQFFTCCHLFVSFSAEDRERGTLSALALSPASVFELLAARFIFHLILGLSVSAIILGIVKPTAAIDSKVWLVLTCVGTAWLSVGTIIASLTKTQAQASMLMFCYMLGGGILFFLSAQFPIFRVIQLMTFENHAVNLLRAAMENSRLVGLPLLLLVTLAFFWSTTAASLFQHRGWQS